MKKKRRCRNRQIKTMNHPLIKSVRECSALIKVWLCSISDSQCSKINLNYELKFVYMCVFPIWVEFCLHVRVSYLSWSVSTCACFLSELKCVYMCLFPIWVEVCLHVCVFPIWVEVCLHVLVSSLSWSVSTCVCFLSELKCVYMCVFPIWVEVCLHVCVSYLSWSVCVYMCVFPI